MARITITFISLTVNITISAPENLFIFCARISHT